jgi:hypothetical protein
MRWFRLLAGLAVCGLATTAQAGSLAEYYVGVDSRAQVSFGGQTHNNPNFGRLTFLFQHGDHFHGIGAYSLTGDPTNPTILDTNANNQIPERYTGLPPIRLFLKDGSYVNKNTGDEYYNFEIRSIQSLAGFPPGSPEAILFNSSGGRWSGSLTGAQIALELISITPGLEILDGMGNRILENVGDQHLITPPGGDGNSFSFTPGYRVDGSALMGSKYLVEYRLVDLSGIYGNSGRFQFVFQAVPEPSSAALLALGVIPVMGRFLARHLRLRRS